MKDEQERLKKITEDALDDLTIKTSDRIIVLSSNKEGLWILNSNNMNPEDSLQMLRNIEKELSKILKKQINNIKDG